MSLQTSRITRCDVVVSEARVPNYGPDTARFIIAQDTPYIAIRGKSYAYIGGEPSMSTSVYEANGNGKPDYHLRVIDIDRPADEGYPTWDQVAERCTTRIPAYAHVQSYKRADPGAQPIAPLGYYNALATSQGAKRQWARALDKRRQMQKKLSELREIIEPDLVVEARERRKMKNLAAAFTMHINDAFVQHQTCESMAWEAEHILIDKVEETFLREEEAT